MDSLSFVCVLACGHHRCTSISTTLLFGAFRPSSPRVRAGHLTPFTLPLLSRLDSSANVTRILALSNFPKELKTRDILAAFAEFDPASAMSSADPQQQQQQQPQQVGGAAAGYKVKWLDDTNLLIVFDSPAVGKSSFSLAISTR